MCSATEQMCRCDTAFLESQPETKACEVVVDTCVQGADIELLCPGYLSEQRLLMGNSRPENQSWSVSFGTVVTTGRADLRRWKPDFNAFSGGGKKRLKGQRKTFNNYFWKRHLLLWSVFFIHLYLKFPISKQLWEGKYMEISRSSADFKEKKLWSLDINYPPRRSLSLALTCVPSWGIFHCLFSHKTGDFQRRHLQVYLSVYRTDVSRTPFFQVMFVLAPFFSAVSHSVLVWGSGRLVSLFQRWLDFNMLSEYRH